MNQLKAGALLSYVNMAVQVCIGLVYVPLLLHFLSIEEYGLYQLIGSLVAYLSVMDFGLSGTITRYYSQRIALNDRDGQENVLALSLIIYLVISVLVYLAGFFLYSHIDTVYGGSLTVGEMQAAKSMLLLLVFNVALTIPSHVFTAAITSHEKFVFLKTVSILQALVQPFIVIAVLRLKAEALSIVQVQVACNICVILVTIWYAFKKIHIRLRLHAFDTQLVKSMLGFSFFIFLNAIVDQIYWKTDQLILGAVSGTAAVAVYAIASQIEMSYIQFSTAVNGVFLPRISRLAALNDDMTEINALFKKTGRIQFAILSLILTGFILFGNMFILLWAGPEFTDAYAIALVVMIPLTIPLIQNTGILILQAKNKHAFRSIVYLIIAIANVAASIPLAKRYGGMGCAVATSVCMFIGNGVVINIYYKKRIGIDINGFFKSIGQMSLPVVFSLLLGFLLLKIFPSTDWLSLVLGILLYCVVYFMLLWFFGFNDYEKDLLRAIARKVKRR